jgi:3-mercaptopyruvate sulfurtransferase SseA
VASTVIDNGFEAQKVYALLGGLQAWEDAGYPVE